MNDVFISYSRRDKVFTQKLYEALTAANRSVWADWDDIPAASDWDAEIKQGIQETNSVLFVLSPEWIKSNECRKEMVHAVAMGKRLFPILYIPVDPKDVPPELAKINWVYMRDSDDFDKAFQTLCSAMDTDLEWIKTHTRIQVRALEWEKKNRSASFALRGEDLTEGEQFIAGAANKSPIPTHLQSEYILASRKDATRRQRQTLAGVTVALVVSIALSIYAVIQQQKAVRQAQIALARQLVTQAQLLNNEEDSKQMVANLLSIQSLKLYPTNDAINYVLGNNFAAPRMIDIPAKNVKELVFSPDNKYIVSVGCAVSDGICINIWEVKTGKEAFPTINDQKSVSEVTFSQDGKHLFVVGCENADKNSTCTNSKIYIYDMDTGHKTGSINTDPNDIVHLSSDQSRIISYTCQGIMFPQGEEMCLPTNIRFLELATLKETQVGCPDINASFSSNTGISPNGKYIFCWGNNSVYLREVETGNALFTTVPPPTGTAFSTVISDAQDGRYVAAIMPSLYSVRLKVWNRWLQSDIINADYPVFDSFPVLIFSPNGQFVIAASPDSRTRIWETGTGNEILKEIPPANSIFFSADSKYFISNIKNVASVHETATGNEIARMTHESLVNSIALSPNGQYAASANNETIRIWKVETATIHPALEEDIQALSSNGKYMVTSSCAEKDTDGHCVQVRINEKEILNGKAVFNRLIDSSSVSNISFNADGRYITGNTDNNSFVWDSATGQEVVKVPIMTDPHISPNGDFLIWEPNGKFSVREVKTGNEITSFNSSFDTYSEISFSPDNKYVVIKGVHQNNTATKIWSAATGKNITLFSATDDQVLAVFSPDSEYLASLDAANTLNIWNVITGKAVGHRHIPTKSSISHILFSPNKNLLAYSEENPTDHANTIHFWDFINNKDFQNNNLDSALSWVFSPDGQYVAIVSTDIHVWDIAKGIDVARINNNANVDSVIFGTDGKYLIAANYDNTIFVWSWQPKDVIESMCAYLPRNLTRAEWEQFISDAMPYQAVCENLPVESKEIATPTAP